MNNPIFDAIAKHDPNAIERLLQAGEDPNAEQSAWPQFNALQAAIDELDEGGPIETIERLIAHGADVNRRGAERDSTPVLMAILRNQHATAELLLQAGGDPNVRGSEGDTALGWSAHQNDLRMLQLLLSHGAAKHIDEISGERGRTPLGYAVEHLNVEMVKALLEAGASPDATDDGMMTAFERMPARTRGNFAEWKEIAELLGC